MASNMENLVLHPNTPEALRRLHRPGFYVLYGTSGIGKKTAVTHSLSSRAVSIVIPEKGSITLDKITEATKQFHLRSGGTQEYFIIDEAHLLTVYAQNALLKTLEELPAHVTVVMVTHEPEQLLETIQSRAFFVHIPAPETAQVREWIDNTASVPREQQTTLLETIGARPAVLYEYLQDASLIDAQNEQYAIFERLCTGSLYQRLLAAAQLHSQMPDVLEKITQFARTRLRQEGGDWTTVVITLEHAHRLLGANGNKKFILDMVVMRKTPWQI